MMASDFVKCINAAIEKYGDYPLIIKSYQTTYGVWDLFRFNIVFDEEEKMLVLQIEQKHYYEGIGEKGDHDVSNLEVPDNS